MDEPPSYASVMPMPAHGSSIPDALTHELAAQLNLPSGCFIVRNKYSGLVLQVKDHKRQHNGSQLELNELKQPTVLANTQSLLNQLNTQLFHLDWQGHLVSASSGKLVDVVNGRVVITSPQPIQAVPSLTSHPPPRFQFDGNTGLLTVLFACDPLYRGPRAPATWPDDTYAIEYVAQRAPPFEPTAWEVASSNLISNIGSRISELGLFVKTPSLASLSTAAPAPPPKERRRQSMPAPMSGSHAHQSPSVRIERVDDSDDEESIARPVRVVRLSPTWRDDYDSSSKEWSKRQWEIVPVVVRPIASSIRISDRNKLPEHMYSFPRSPAERDLPNLPSPPALSMPPQNQQSRQRSRTEETDADLLSEEAIAAQIDALSVSSAASTRQGTPNIPQVESLAPATEAELEPEPEPSTLKTQSDDA